MDRRVSRRRSQTSLVVAEEAHAAEDPSALQRIVEYAAVRVLARQFPSRNAHGRSSTEIPFNPYREHIPEFGGVLPFVLRLLKTILLSGLLLTVSLASYWMCYQAAMPSRHSSKLLYFDYTGSTLPRLMAAKVPFLPVEDSESSYQGPWALVDLFSKQPHWEAFSHEILPPPTTSTRLLQPKQDYYIEIVLDLPESEHNQMLGMFGVVTELYSRNGTKLALSRRSMRIPHESHWISVVRKMALLAPLLIGAMEETRTVTVPSFRHIVESLDLPLQYILVQVVMPRDPILASKTVEITGGEIWIGKELNSVQEIMRHWFYTCATLGTAVFAFFYLSLFLVLKLVLESVGKPEEPACDLASLPEDEPQDFEPIPVVDDDEPHTIPLRNGTNSSQLVNETERVHRADRRHPQTTSSAYEDANIWEDLNFITPVTPAEAI
jgi:hypothetical protein